MFYAGFIILADSEEYLFVLHDSYGNERIRRKEELK
jgi:hypothetical protein